MESRGDVTVFASPWAWWVELNGEKVHEQEINPVVVDRASRKRGGPVHAVELAKERAEKWVEITLSPTSER